MDQETGKLRETESKVKAEKRENGIVRQWEKDIENAKKRMGKNERMKKRRIKKEREKWKATGR